MDDESREKLAKVYDIVLIGNGKEPLVIQVARNEERTKAIKETMDSMDRKLNKIFVAVAVVLVTFIGEMIVRGIWH